MSLYRIYWSDSVNPQWAIDNGSPASEINVQDVRIGDEVDVRFRTAPQAADAAGVLAWVEVRGVLSIDNGVAYVRVM